MSMVGRCIANAATHHRILFGMSLALAVGVPRPWSANAQSPQFPDAPSSVSQMRILPGQAHSPDNPTEVANLQTSKKPRVLQIPLRQGDTAGGVKLESGNGWVTLFARDASLKDILALVAQNQGLNLVCADTSDAKVSITLHEAPLEDALTALASVAGCTWTRHNNIIHVFSLADAGNLPPEIQGLQMKVFQLNYSAAEDLDEIVKGMLSPVGSSYIISSDPADNRKAKDKIVAEDLPAFLARIEQQIKQMDVPPRQVLIEVHVLEVDLEDGQNHGVNFDQLARFGANNLRLGWHGFADPLAPQAAVLELNGGDTEALIQCLKTTSDAKTLASPKVLVVDGQEAKFQVGQRLPYVVTTTSQTSTQESVNFLDTGIVLSVTPRIGPNDQILLQAKPEVSSGQVNPTTGLPETETSHVETDVLLRNGQGMVIGGLIQEQDSNTQSKVTHLGDIHLLGHLFRTRQLQKERSEIIFVLVPHLLPYPEEYEEANQFDVMRATTPIVHGPLERYPRPWEPSLPDAIYKPQHYILPGGERRACRHQPLERSREYYEPTMPPLSPTPASPDEAEPEPLLDEPDPFTSIPASFEPRHSRIAGLRRLPPVDQEVRAVAPLHVESGPPNPRYRLTNFNSEE